MKRFPGLKHLFESKLAVLLTTILITILLATGLFFLNKHFLVTLPVYGGELSIGEIGAPRFINPLLTQSQSDRDLTTLVFAGLFRKNGNNTEPLLAENVEITEDGKKYTIKIREDAIFHDGQPVTAHDVLWTINAIQDPLIKSPYQSLWDGVVFKEVDEKTVEIELSAPYSGFLEQLDIGIMPAHIWEQVPVDHIIFSEYNLSPIGSGPFIVTSITKDSAGIPVMVGLEAFRGFADGRPFIQNLQMLFFENNESLLQAYGDREIESFFTERQDIDEMILEDSVVSKHPTSKHIYLFLNQNLSPILRNADVRQAIDKIINNDDINGGEKLLQDQKWVKNQTTQIYEKEIDDEVTQLSFSIATTSFSDLDDLAVSIRNKLFQAGILARVQVFEPGSLKQEIIRERAFESLIFGQNIEHPADLFAFWHSSQKLDPGLNISLFENSRADKVLENIRESVDIEEMLNAEQDFFEILETENPAIHLQNIQLLHVLPGKIEGYAKDIILDNAEDRLANINSWFIETDDIWSFLRRR